MTRSTIERVCPVCDRTFHVPPSRLAHGRGIHCSKACQYEANKAKLNKGAIVSITCEGCGCEFERFKSRADKARFCTRECRDEHWKGELTPNWQDGSGVYKRGPHWHSIRRGILERDEHTCRHCGTQEDLHVHHKIPFRMFDDHQVANDEGNLITLCAPCHRKEDAARKWIKIGGVIVSMSPETWSLYRAANDNTTKRRAA